MDGTALNWLDLAFLDGRTRHLGLICSLGLLMGKSFGPFNLLFVVFEFFVFLAPHGVDFIVRVLGHKG